MRRIRKYAPVDSCAESGRTGAGGKDNPDALTPIPGWVTPPVFALFHLIIHLIGQSTHITHPRNKTYKLDQNTEWVSKWKRQERGAEGGKGGSATEGINVSLLTASTTNHPLSGNNSDT